jgi:hypothetical protein
MLLLCLLLLSLCPRWYYLGDAYEIAGDCRSGIQAWGTCAESTVPL